LKRWANRTSWLLTPPALKLKTKFCSLPKENFQFWVEFMLWPTISWPICLGVGHPFEAHDNFFFLYFSGQLLCS
jgi:hypothetical protein